MRKHNLHTHTTYSDGDLSPEQLVESAKQSNLEIIGICDHAFSTKISENYQITSRLEQYLNHLKKLQQSSNGINLKIGVEIDVSETYGTKPSELPFDILNRFDYILFEYVNTENESWGRVGSRDISEIIEVRNRLKIPVGLAHNDLQKNYEGREKEIAMILSKNNIFIELNQSECHPSREEGRNTREDSDYYQLFSDKLIEHLAKPKGLPFIKNVKFVVGTDSHSGKNLDEVNDAYQFIKKNHLSYHDLVK
jgi:histidinol phosphatase-like PHP family hydrolase